MDKLELGQPELIGREEELSKLKSTLNNAVDGKGSTIFLSGEAGIGKTMLVDAFRNYSTAQNLKILNGAASADSAQPFLMFSKALEQEINKPLFEEQEIKKFVKIFAINRAGLLVAQSSSEDEGLDADIFAGMLSAVQNFVGDSLEGEDEKTATLGRLEYGDMKILMEHGQHLYLTAVFSGNEHPDMTTAIRRTLQNIEENNLSILENWSGNMEDLKPIQGDIERLADIEFFVRRGLVGVKLDNERIRIADEVLEVLKKSSTKKPMVIFLEDLHWADESSLFVINYLARNIRDSPIFMLGTLRSRESESLQNIIEGMKAEKILEEMELQKLGLDNTAEIIDMTYPENNFPETLAQRLYEQSKGNPLFVTEMLKGMHDDGSVARQNGEYTLVSESYHIPATVEEVVNHRLEVLDSQGMAIVEYSSCIGQKFECLAAFSIQSLNNPQEALGSAQNSQIITRYNGTAEFSHAMFQNVIYNSIGNRWKATHHKNLGEYYEEVYADKLDEVIYELARHYSKTNENKKLIDYCTRAGEKAEGSYAMEQALEFYKKALNAMPDQDKAADLQERIGDVLATMGHADEAIENFQKAKEAVEDKEAKSRLLRKCSTILTNNGEFDRSLELMQEARTYLEDGKPQELGRILLCDGTTYWRKGDFDRAMEMLKEALSIFEKLPGADDIDIATTLNGIANVHYTRGEMNEAMDIYRRSLELNEKIGNEKEIALLLGNVAGVYHGLGKLDDSLEYFSKSLEIREKVGDLLGIAQTQNNVGVINQDLGKLDEALVALNQSLDIAEKMGSKVGVSIILYNIGSIYHAKGDLDRALDIYERGIKIREEIGERQGLAYSMYNIGRICNTQGHKDKAKKHYENCLEICQEIGDKQLSVHPISSLAEFRLEEGYVQEALEMIETAVKTSMDISARGEEGRCRRILAMVYREIGDLEKASEELETSRTILEEVGHKEELARVFKEYAFFYKAKGELDKAKQSLEEAISMFEGMGMKLWAKECEILLSDLLT